MHGGYYVTLIRDGAAALIAGPFDTWDQADAKGAEAYKATVAKYPSTPAFAETDNWCIAYFASPHKLFGKLNAYLWLPTS